MNILKDLFKSKASSHYVPIQWNADLMPQQELNIIENPIVYRCIKLIAQNIASIPVKVSNSILDQKIKKPNQSQKLNHMMQKIISDMLIEGSCYLLYTDDGSFYRAEPNSIADLYDSTGTLIGYSYQTNKGTKKILFDAEGKSPILNIQYISPSGDTLSPCKVIKKSVQLYNSIMQYNQSVMDNMASFGGALIIKGNLKENDKIVLRQEINKRTGSAKAGYVPILSGPMGIDINWEPMNANAKEAGYVEAQNSVAREIMQVFGVPPNLLGISDVAYNNYEQARLFFWQDILRPLALYIYDELETWLSEVYQVNCKIELDFSAIPAFATQTRELLQVIGTDCLTTQEKRCMLGMSNLD